MGKDEIDFLESVYYSWGALPIYYWVFRFLDEYLRFLAARHHLYDIVPQNTR